MRDVIRFLTGEKASVRSSVFHARAASPLSRMLEQTEGQHEKSGHYANQRQVSKLPKAAREYTERSAPEGSPTIGIPRTRDTLTLIFTRKLFLDPTLRGEREG